MSFSRSQLRHLLLIASEVMWISFVLSAMSNTWPNFSMSIPYWALLLPALAALALSTFIAKSVSALTRRLYIVALPAFVVIAIGSGILASTSPANSFWRTAFSPWSVDGARNSSITTLAWLEVALVVIRSLQIVFTKDTFGQTIRSVVVASIAYFGMFLAIATQHSARLDSATRSIEPIFLVYFLLAISMLRLSRATDLERANEREDSPLGDPRWRLLLALPLVVVAVISLFVTAALGSKSSHLHHALLDIAHAITWFFSTIGHGLGFALVHVALAVVAVVSFFVNLIVHRHFEAPWTKVAHKAVGQAATTPSHAPIGVSIGIVVIFFIGVAIGLNMLLRNRRPAVVERGQTGGDRRTSTFTWRSFLDQILSVFSHLGRSLMARFQRHSGMFAQPAPGTLAPIGLRRDLQQLLYEAKRIGYGRLESETINELANRLFHALDDVGRSALSKIAQTYDLVRYGADSPSLDLGDEVTVVLDQLRLIETATPPDPAKAGKEGVTTKLARLPS